MKTETKTSITALLNVDPTVPLDVRKAIISLLNGKVSKKSKLITVAEAAERLQVHPKTVLRYARDGKLEVLKLSRRKILIRSDELDRFIESSTTKEVSHV